MLLYIFSRNININTLGPGKRGQHFADDIHEGIIFRMKIL